MIKTPTIIRLWRAEFGGYDRARFTRDLVAGLTVAAVALPLALAFGVASSATAAAGLVTAIIAGFLIGALSGAPYQISGPTGAMAAILVVVVQKHGLQGLWLAGVMAGTVMLLLGLLKLGSVINFIPAPVITGFTSGIALIIFIGQIDNFLGIQTPSEEIAALKAIAYFTHPIPAINLQAIICGLIVAAVMLLLPRFPATHRFPAALIGIAIVTALSWSLGWGVATIGEIPATILLEDRFRPETVEWSSLGQLVVPAAAIAALGAIESLLAGAVAGRMTGTKLNANQELIAQGVGNIAIPFFGGVPATAAIARMSVGVRAGGITRMVSFIHSAALLLGALFLGGIIGRIPLAALAGVLMVTAFRMNEWHLIRFYIRRRLKSPTTVMLATMLATITLDLTQAIIVGVVLSLLLFISQVSRLTIVSTDVDPSRLAPTANDGKVSLPISRSPRNEPLALSEAHGEAAPAATGLPPGSSPQLSEIKVIYITGPLFFGAASQLVDGIEQMGQHRVLIFSMRGVPLMDASGLHAIEHIWQNQHKHGGLLYLTGLQPQVHDIFARSGLIEAIGEDHFLWSADLAINSALDRLRGRQPDATGIEAVSISEDQELDEMPLGVVKVD
jgi:SulP family sulfate permease